MGGHRRRGGRLESRIVTGGAGASVSRASDRVGVPWRNGGGTTTVVAAEPDWRVSIATIAEAGDFSVFPGVDRVLMPLSPAGLTLAIAGRIRPLAQYEAASFSAADGETVLVIVLEGDVSGADGPLLNRDAVLLPSGAAVELIGHGALAVVRVWRPY
jgi:hypothetical protein